MPLDVPGQGLSPEALLRTYDVESLAKQGFTGKGQTVVVFAFDGVDQPDLDMFTSMFGLPKFTPDVVGGMASQRTGEATMDLEAIHALAPEAKTVLVNARPTVEGSGAYEKIADDDGGRPASLPGSDLELFHRVGLRQADHHSGSRPDPRGADEPHMPRAPPHSTPAGTWRAWNAKAARTGRHHRVPTRSVWTRWPRSRR